jgi:general stress protein 26
MTETRHSADAIRKFNDLVRDIKFAMLTTEQQDGFLRSRPMVTQEADEDGTLWFFTGQSTPKVYEIRHHQQVNVAYSAPDDHRYISVSGIAETVRDQARVRELWNPLYRAYFPKGVDDPDLVLLKITVQEVEYWESSSSRMVRMAGWVKALVTGDREGLGEHGKLDVA